ncbi:hypothetical protein HNQ50_003556 [Silvimonas terrae]|uniref:Uncharacterized protein n=1 Tax=Silvimonas terrae TaxID=300266 RepID=A0A840RKQ5_9NEIS|nr:hypothetical protein [Silvimonas terrae]MBB5192802.1 hypothetical protein [Silvimonas terrae]
MPFDLDQISPVEAVPPIRIGWGKWLLLLVLMMGAGAAALLLGAPKLLPTAPVLLWLAIVGVPALLWLILLCFAIGHQQSLQTDVKDANLQRQIEMANTVNVAGIPLAVLAAAYRVDAAAVKISSGTIAARQIRRMPQLRYSKDAQTVDARWLEAPGRVWLPEMPEQARHEAVLAWVLQDLFRQLQPALAALPEGTPVQIHLHADTRVSDESVQTLWQEAGAEYARHLHLALPVVSAELPDLAAVERWLWSP